MDFWIKPLMAVNTFLYHLSAGTLGSRMAGQNVLLLHNIGRKTGMAHTTPVNYYRDRERYIVVASNWGKENNPDWFSNLMRQPVVTIEVKNRRLRVRASTAVGDEYERLWKLVTSENSFYTRYQQQTRRRIPIVILTELTPG